MVENYFKTISDKEYKNDIEISPNVLELTGIIKIPDNLDLKSICGNHLAEKYLR